MTLYDLLLVNTHLLSEMGTGQDACLEHGATSWQHCLFWWSHDDHSYKTCVCCLQDGSTPLHYAAAFGQTHVLETLVKAGIAIDNRDDARNTPLHLAAGQSSSSAAV